MYACIKSIQLSLLFDFKWPLSVAWDAAVQTARNVFLLWEITGKRHFDLIGRRRRQPAALPFDW